MIVRVTALLLCGIGIVAGFLRAEETPEAEFKRDEKGVHVTDDYHVDIPDDRKVYQVAHNVVRMEDMSQYTSRRLEEFSRRLDTIESRIAGVEARVEALEPKAETQARAAIIE